MPTFDTSALAKAAMVTLGFALLWAVLAWSRPTTTFHLGSLIVAGTLPFAYATGIGGAPTRLQAITLTVAATAAALATTGVLAAAEKMHGGSLLPAGGPIFESILFAFVGGSIGLLAAVRSPVAD